MTNLKSLVFKLREYLNEGGVGSGNFGHVHKGLGGTWTQKFVDNRTGDLFRIKAVPNGKGLYGTNYAVSKIPGKVKG